MQAGKTLVVASPGTESLHVVRRWAIPDYFRANPTADNGRTLEAFFGGGAWPLTDGVAPPIPLAARGFRMLVPLPKR